MNSTRHHRVRSHVGLVITSLAALASSPWMGGDRAAVHAAVTPEQVDAAVEKAKQYLYSQQQPTGHWEVDNARKGTKHDWEHKQGDAFGGYSALATYALLAAGESPQDPRVIKAVRFLEDADVMGIYSLGIRANVWLLLPSSDRRAHSMAQHDAQAIIAGMNNGAKSKDHENKGFWQYGNGRGEDGKGTGALDHSASQYGVLGLWACAQNNVEVSRDVWQTIDAGWKSHQFPDGGWQYNGTPKNPSKDHQETPSMTAAGVATLFITEEMLYADKGIECRGNITNENIEKGLTWMADNIQKVGDPYTFYGVERIGVASGRKYFGSTDWYAMGAERLVHSQKPDGSWDYGLGGPVAGTGFATLFLVRGRAPIMMNKLAYEVHQKLTDKTVEGNWNQRPRDVANLARWTGNRLERDLNFQIVNLKAPVDDLHDAPILYLSGSDEMNFTAEEEAKVKLFVEGGGLVLANADCGVAKPLFAKSFMAIARKLFPKYEFRDLPANHPIFTNQPFLAAKWKEKQRVIAMSNGVREMFVLIPEADPAKQWQIRADATHDYSFELGADVFLYSVERQNFHNKGQTYIVHADEKIKAERTAKVARLIVGDNPDPEPGAWRRLAAVLHNNYKDDVTVEPVKLGEQKLAGYKLAHLTGTTKFSLNPEQRAQLTEFIVHGGTVVIDAAGGSTDFADAAEAELRAIFGKEADTALADPIDEDSPLFNLANAKLGAVGYRAFYKARAVGKLKTARLHGITRGNRIAVFYSREDLTAGMVGEPVDGIMGYTPQTATDLMRNIVLYSAFNVRPAPATQPAPATKPVADAGKK